MEEANLNQLNKPRIVIRSLGHYHPENAIDSSFFEKLDIGSDTKWIIDRTGIKSRRSVLSETDILALRNGQTTLRDLRKQGKVMSLASMAEKSWLLLCERSEDSADLVSKVDGVICGTSVPDYDIPANACTIAAKIGAECPSFDVNSACSSFVINLHTVRGLLESGLHSRVAVFNPERYSSRMDYSDKTSCVLFGDGCSSALIERSDDASGLEILDTAIYSDPKSFNVVAIPDGDCFRQEGRAVQKFAISRTIQSTKLIMERNNLTANDVDYFIGHQANLRMLESSVNRLEFPAEKHLHNVDIYGNQGAAGAPSILSMNWDRYKKGDIIIITVVGSGLTWGSVLMRKV